MVKNTKNATVEAIAAPAAPYIGISHQLPIALNPKAMIAANMEYMVFLFIPIPTLVASDKVYNNG